MTAFWVSKCSLAYQCRTPCSLTIRKQPLSLQSRNTCFLQTQISSSTSQTHSLFENLAAAMFELTWESKTLTLWPQLVQHFCLTIFCQSTSMGVHVYTKRGPTTLGKTRKFAELCEGNRWKATDASPWELCFAVPRPPPCRTFAHATDQFQAYAPGMSQRSAHAPPVSLPLRHVDL